MKKFMKSMLTAVATVIGVVALSGAAGVSAKAEGITYAVKYLGGTYNEWRYQQGSTFDEGITHNALIQLTFNYLKDGDSIVVYSDDLHDLKIDDVALGSVTIAPNSTANVTVKSAEEFVACRNTVSAIHGKLKDALVCDIAACTIDGDVTGTLTVQCETHETMSAAGKTTVQVTGTIGKMQLVETKTGNIKCVGYTVKSADPIYNNGAFNVPDARYSTTAPAGSETPAKSPAKDKDNDFDKVPKTGEANTAGVLFFASMLCFGAALALKKREAR